MRGRRRALAAQTLGRLMSLRSAAPSLNARLLALVFARSNSRPAARFSPCSSVPLLDRRLQLTEPGDSVRRALPATIVSKRVASAYRSGPSRDWVKIKTAGWRAANRERWRLFESQ